MQAAHLPAFLPPSDGTASSKFAVRAIGSCTSTLAIPPIDSASPLNILDDSYPRCHFGLQSRREETEESVIAGSMLIDGETHSESRSLSICFIAQVKFYD